MTRFEALLCITMIVAVVLVLGFAIVRPAEAGSVTAATSVRSGQATWYCCTRGYSASSYVAAAGPALRIGHWRGRYVTVWSGLRHVRVRLVDYCVCRAGVVIDLEPGAFRVLAPLSRGVVKVRVSW